MQFVGHVFTLGTGRFHGLSQLSRHGFANQTSNHVVNYDFSHFCRKHIHHECNLLVTCNSDGNVRTAFQNRGRSSLYTTGYVGRSRHEKFRIRQRMRFYLSGSIIDLLQKAFVVFELLVSALLGSDAHPGTATFPPVSSHRSWVPSASRPADNRTLPRSRTRNGR